MILPVGDAPNPRGFRPWVTWSILLLNTLVYLALLPARWRPPSPDAPELPGLLEALATGTRSADPALLVEGLTAHDLVLFEHGLRTLAPSAVDLLTSLFLHADLLHLGGNLLFLWIYGDNVEHRLGRLRFVAAYLGSGAAAALGHAALAGPSALPLVGASGAISGVLGFYFVLFPANHVRLLVLLPPFFARRLLVSARLVLAAYLLFDNVLPLVVGRGVGGVAHGAHIGGFAVGALVALALAGWTGGGLRWGREGSGGALAAAVELRDGAAALRALDRASSRELQGLSPPDRLALAGWLLDARERRRAAATLRPLLRQPTEEGARANLMMGELLLSEDQPAAAYASLRRAARQKVAPDVAAAAQSRTRTLLGE